jgi:hypothetical protein
MCAVFFVAATMQEEPMSEFEKHRHHDDGAEDGPDVEAHKMRRHTDDGTEDDQPDVEAHKMRRRTDDGTDDDDQPDVEAHKFY